MDLKLNLSLFSSSENKVEEGILYDVLIIGGGPAAMNAVLYCARKRINTVMITDDIGGQIVQSASIENWIGDIDIKSSVLVNRFYDHIQKFDLPIKRGVRVTSLQDEGQIKKVVCSDGKVYQSKAVIIATGKSPRMLGIPGESEFIGRGVAYCTTCDGPAFFDKKVVIVGGGNSGVEAAIDMLSYAKDVVVVQNLSELTADSILIEKLVTDTKVRVIYDSICVRIAGKTNVEQLIVLNSKDNKEHVIKTDAVFVEIGLLPASRFVPDSLKNECGEIIINADCSTSIPGIYAAGDVTDVPFKQVIIAAGDGAKAALAVYNYIIKNK